MSVPEVAQLLGRNRSSVTRRINRQSLWAISLSGRLRLPRWQFTADGSELPGLATVVKAIPAGYSAKAVDARVHAPIDELGGLNVIDFLTEGGDPTIAAQLVAQLDRW